MLNVKQRAQAMNYKQMENNKLATSDYIKEDFLINSPDADAFYLYNSQTKISSHLRLAPDQKWGNPKRIPSKTLTSGSELLPEKPDQKSQCQKKNKTSDVIEELMLNATVTPLHPIECGHSLPKQ